MPRAREIPSEISNKAGSSRYSDDLHGSDVAARSDGANGDQHGVGRHRQSELQRQYVCEYEPQSVLLDQAEKQVHPITSEISTRHSDPERRLSY
jgi:hypothetical protein